MLAAVLATAAAATASHRAVAAGSSTGTLEGRIAASQAREGELHSGIGADTHQIEGFQGNIDDLQTRLDALESSLATERDLLASLKSQLHGARTHLASLQVQLGRDRQVLVAQLIASYESPPPDIATVVLQAHGFADLIERLDDLRAISRENAGATVHVAEEQKAVTVQAAQLATLEASHARETSAVLVQRDEVSQLHLALVNRQLEYISARDRKSSELGALRVAQALPRTRALKARRQRTRRRGRRGRLHRPGQRLLILTRRRIRLLPRRRHRLQRRRGARRSPRT